MPTTAAPARPRPSTVPQRLLVLAACAGFLHLVFFRGGTFIYQFHKASSGAWMDEAVRVLDGQTMYRDFADEVGPGIVHLNAALLAVFGRHLDVLAYAGLGTGCLLALALHALAARLVEGAARLLAPAVAAGLVYPPFEFGHPRWLALTLSVLALERLAAGPPRNRRALMAGVLFGLAALFAFDVAAAVALGAVLFLASRRQARCATTLMVGATAPVLAAFAWFAWQAGAPAVAAGWIMGPVRQRLWLAGSQVPVHWGLRAAALLSLAAGALTAAALTLARRTVAEAAATRAVAIAGLPLLVLGLIGPFDPYAAAVHALVLTPLLAAVASEAAASAGPARWPARALLAVLLSGLAYAAAGLVVWRQWMQPLVRQRFRAGEAWIGAPNVELAWLEREAPAGAPTFVFPAGAGAYFLTRTVNVTPFPFAIPGRFDDARAQAALAAIDAGQPPIGLWLGGQESEVDGGPLDRLRRGVLRSYVVDARGADGTLMLRRRR